VADVDFAGQLAEIGVMLLMLGVGLHFSLKDLLAVKRIAIPGALLQIAVAAALGMGTAALWGWNLVASHVFGLALSVASTVVLLRALESRGVLESMNGQIAVGWLIVEDLVMVLVLVLLPALSPLLGGMGTENAAPDQNIWATFGITLAKVGAFIALMLVVGRRVFPKLLWLVARTGSRELFTLCVIAGAVSVAYASAKLFDVSFALGAFFAGMMMRESEFSHRAAEESLPLRDAFSVLFFVSFGMLFDPQVLIDEPLKVLAVVAIIMVGKTIAAVVLVVAFRYPLNSGLTVGASLARSRSTRCCSARPCRCKPGCASAPPWRGVSNGLTIRLPNCRRAPTRRCSPARSCCSATAVSASGSRRRWRRSALLSWSPSRTASSSRSGARKACRR